VLIVMAGLPGTGKSTLAARLAAELSGVVLSKDEVRAVLFPGAVLDYSNEQDDTAMSAIYSAAAYILKANPSCAVILDGRTFSKPGQLDAPSALARSLGQSLRVIECICSESVARERLAADFAAGTHLAGNRSPELFARVKAEAQPITVPRLTLDTGELSIEECVRKCAEYLA
jgi:adenylylsulfate kinase